MKNLILILFLVGCSNLSFKAPKSGVKTEFKHSEAASFLHFLDSGFHQPHTSGAMKELIVKKNLKAFESGSSIKEYSIFKSYLQKGYSFPAVAARPRGVYGEDTLYKIAANSDSLAEFEKNLSLVLPYDGINSYFSLKEKFYEDFKRKIWKPTLSLHDDNLEKIYKTIDRSGFFDYLKKARKFYRSNYPRELPLKVALVPIADSGLASKHTSALNLGDIQIVPYLVTKGADASMDVVFHEFCHAFFKGQSLAIQKKMEKFYLTHPSKHALFVYRYLNEALATAWGNGWYAELKNGQLTKKPWYTVGYIDTLARKLLPLIKSYTERGKLLDENFMKESIELAESAFPNADRELKANTMAIKILSNQKQFPINELSNKLRNSFRVHWMSRSYPMSKEDVASLSRKTFYTTLILSSPEKTGFREIQGRLGLKKVRNKKDFFAIIPKGNQYFLWIHSNNKKKISKAIETLENKALLPRSKKIISL